MTLRVTFDTADFEGVRLALEHGWLCARTERGWLLWSIKAEAIPSEGLSLSDILSTVASAKRLDDQESMDARHD